MQQHEHHAKEIKHKRSGRGVSLCAPWTAPSQIPRRDVVVSDVHGQSARATVKAIIAGKSVPDVLSPASNRLRASRQDIFEALQGEELAAAHRLCLNEIMAHIEELEPRVTMRHTGCRCRSSTGSFQHQPDLICD